MRQEPIETLSVCSYKVLSNEKTVLVQASRSNFFSVRLDNVVSINPSVKTRLNTKLSVHFSSTLVNSDSMSKETKRKPSSNKFCGIAFMAETASKESLRWYSLIVSGFKSEETNLPTL